MINSLHNLASKSSGSAKQSADFSSRLDFTSITPVPQKISKLMRLDYFYNSEPVHVYLLNGTRMLPAWAGLEAGSNSSETIQLDYFYNPTPVDSSLLTESPTTSDFTEYEDTIGASGDILPYGVQAVYGGEDITEWGNFAEGTTVFIIDSGVSDGTNDLNLNEEWSKSWVDDEPFVDQSGHGTHVAGTVAAKVNGVGVVGVAPGAEVVSLKVFGRSGTGSYEDIIEAVEYAAEIIIENDMQDTAVINMSLGGLASPELDQVVQDAAAQGVVFSIAAGNSGADADLYSPARTGDLENVYVTSAVDNEYVMASWSNYDNSARGDDVDYAAPGVDVVSYYRNDQLAYLSGTSMATPHVTGLLLTGGVKPGEEVDPNRAGNPDPFSLALNMDTNDDGLVDDTLTYQLFSKGDAIDITNSGGRTFSDFTNANWDALVAVESGTDGFALLLEGTARREDQFFAIETNSSGVIVQGSGSRWESTDDAIALGWEGRFSVDLNQDGAISSSIV